MRIFSLITIFLLLSFGVMPRAATLSEHIEGRVEGMILNLACEPLNDAQITLTNKKTTQLIRPENNGHFIVDLPVGDYLVAISTSQLGRIKSSALSVQRGRSGELHLFVNTGVQSTCPCFSTDIEDILIPVEPVKFNIQIQERKLISVP